MSTNVSLRYLTQNVMHGKSHFIHIFATCVHTEHGTTRHGTSQQSTDGNLTFAHDILFPVRRCGNVHFYALVSLVSATFVEHEFLF